MRGQYIPINKGNYEMDTFERNKLFEENRGFGWESEYSAYRKNWEKYAKEHIVSDYPLLVDVELSSACNLHCPMCYTITDEFRSKVKRQFMEMEVFHKVIDEIAGKVVAVRLSLRGEPTLHPYLIECIKYCKQHSIREVSFLTNGSKLDEENFIKMAEAGVDWITVSVDGVGEEYEKIRKPLKFEDTIDKLERIRDIKLKKGWKRPVIKAQGIWPAIKKNPSKYYNILSSCVDLVAFNPLIDYLDNDSQIEYINNFSCPQLYQRIIVASDGKVFPCSNDEQGRYVIGDMYKQSLYEIWHSVSLEYLRKLHREGRFLESEICKHCYLPRKTESSEHAFVNDREIIISNYVGRSQTVGM